MDRPILQFSSRIAGKNATIRVWPTYLELDTPSTKSAVAAVATMGVSLAAKRRHHVDTIPIRSVSSVTTRDRFTGSTVYITTPALTIEANVDKRQAQWIKSTLLRLINEGPQAFQQGQVQAPTQGEGYGYAPQGQVPQPPAAPAPPAAPDLVGQLRQLGELHQQGILTDAEFEAKKADILSRM